MSESIRGNQAPSSNTAQDYEDFFGEFGDTLSEEDDIRETFRLSFAVQSRRFRCSVTGKLMTNPFEDLKGDLVDESQLVNFDSVRRDQYRPNEALREEIREFSKSTISSLSTYLTSSDVRPALIDIAGECLSVLRPERDQLTFTTLFEQIELGQRETLMQNLQRRGFDLTEFRRRAEDLESAEATIKGAYQATKQLILRLLGGEARRSRIPKGWLGWYLPDVLCLVQTVKEQDKLYNADYETISSALTKEVKTLENFKLSQVSNEALQLMVDAHLAKLHDIEAFVTDLVSRTPIEELPHDPRQPLEEYYTAGRYTLLKTKIIKGVASLTPVIKLSGSRWIVIDAGQGLLYKYEHPRFSTLDLRRDLAEAVLPSPIETQKPSSLVGYEGVIYSIGRNSNWDEFEHECERYFISERRRESLPPLHTDALVYFSVVLESTECLYALGHDKSFLSVIVQELNLRTLTWRVLGSFEGDAEGTYYFKGSSTTEFYFIDNTRGCYALRPGKDNFTVEKIADTRREGVQMAMILRGHLVYAGTNSLEVLVEKLKD
jgi:hypothetical protein